VNRLLELEEGIAMAGEAILGLPESQIEAIRQISRDKYLMDQAQDAYDLRCIRQERDQVRQELDTVRQERDTVKQERDAVGQELDTIKQERDTVKQELDAALQEIAELKKTAGHSGQRP
jgi:uncharacterized coiled-coil DUF342 family protein